MNVLVTGAAGFIGSHLAEHLAVREDQVIGVDNFDPYYNTAFKHRNADLLRSRGAEVRQLDVRDHEAIASLIDVVRPDVVVHLAAKAGVRNSVQFPRQYVDVNLHGTQSVFDAALRSDVGRVVLASTSSVYGDSSDLPFRESEPCVVPLQPYAFNKRSAEMLDLCQRYLW